MSDQVPTTIAGWRRHLAANWQTRFGRGAYDAYQFGFVYCLAVIERYVDGEKAELFARDLHDLYEAGDSFGEWIWQWQSEDIRGLPLTLPFEL